MKTLTLESKSDVNLDKQHGNAFPNDLSPSPQLNLSGLRYIMIGTNKRQKGGRLMCLDFSALGVLLIPVKVRVELSRECYRGELCA